MHKQQPAVSMAMYEEQLQLLKEKFTLMEKRISLKADEVVFTMSVSHRKEIDQLKDEVILLREQLKKVNKEQQEIYVKKYAGAARRRSVG
ncbi:hypothetical protein MUO14_00615 [Halobacillus shinanisalinarum]|uniref:YgaB-like protein n=1 Tax=Halobacillus shinanisalinarum TaxID=2932258 RepID=A0ABY4GZL9_9BACI|nr:hypothetical protein [Halobacillus shinanisalinarum]UOQ93544.1 hypothetical protein MUO14_00615 [Halobacillus shinanisalinarum]